MRLLGAFVLLTVALLPACGDPDSASVKLQVVFPSPGLAIAANEVKITVYDDPVDGACERVYLKRISKQTNFPPVVLDPPPVPLCAIALGNAPSLELPVGRYSILVVALRAKEDLLVGCSDVTLSSDGGDVVVNLALPGSTPAPSPLSGCVSVRESCENRCQ